ncbi:hypothetical protein TNCV_1130081 [Trichonephila clavipes]|nr:hypothetical protein TNCV_1130081 [Trichonephila clavipes]
MFKIPPIWLRVEFAIAAFVHETPRRFVRRRWHNHGTLLLDHTLAIRLTRAWIRNDWHGGTINGQKGRYNVQNGTHAREISNGSHAKMNEMIICK